MRLHLDFETRSTVDLRVTGAYRYAEDPETEVILACYAVDDGPVQTWFHTDAVALPEDLRAALEDDDCIIVAHNAGFEKAMMRYIMGPRHGWPVPPPHRWDDTAARAARQALPRSLEGAAMALGLEVQKDTEGRSLMLRMCRPRSVAEDGKITWWDDDARMKRLAQYCATDVEVERELDKILRQLTPEEREIWLLTEEMNDRGVAIDVDFATYAVQVASEAQEALNKELNEITDGAVTAATNVGKLRQWLLSKGFGVLEGEDESLNKKAVENLLKSNAIPDDVRRVLEIRLLAGKSSVKKFQAMLDRVSKDGRVRGNLVYHGASTGRWSGAGVQLQNLPRDTVKDFEWSRKNLTASTDKALSTLSRMVRGSIMAAPEHRLMWADYAAVEARGVAWLAGQQDLIDLFAKGGKVYEEMAAVIFNVPAEEIGKDSLERFIGKTCIAQGTLVLTDQGPVPIERVTTAHKLWDGENWVCHQGLLYKGLKETVPLCGSWLTPDHLVLCGTEWLPAATVLQDKNILSQVLATGVENLSCPAILLEREKAFLRLFLNAIVAHQNTHSRTIISNLSKLHAAHVVPQNLLAQLTSYIGRMATSFQTMLTVNDYSTASAQSFPAATPHPIKFSDTTADAVSLFVKNGGRIAENFCNTLRRLMVGMTLHFNSTASTIMQGMNRAISALLPMQRIWRTGEQSVKCNNALLNLKRKLPVYDLANAGPLHRFTILTDSGPVIVHNCILGCGYSMGAQKFRMSCAAMGTEIDEELAYRAVNAYRSNYAKIPRLWKMLDEAAIAAIGQRGRETTYRSVSFYADKNWLLIKLPSGRKLFYRDPRLVTYAGPYGEKVSVEYSAVNSMTKKWNRERTFGGKLTENIVQGLCRDLIADAMLRLETNGYPVIASVHDEVISEVPVGQGSIEEMVALMCQLPDWAKDFPLAAEGKEGVRYGK